MSTPSAPVLEVAVFTVREPGSFAQVQQQTHAALATLPGHRGGLRLRGRDGSFADLVAWESFEAAQRASAQVREDPRFAPLFASLERLQHYAHYQLSVDVAALLAELREAPLVEIAAYAVADIAAQLRAHGQLHEALRTQAGQRGGAPGRQVEDPGQFLDLIGWQSADAHHRAGAALQQRGELAELFAGIGDMHVFELFSVLDESPTMA